MYRIIRTVELRHLHRDRAELQELRVELNAARTEADTATDSAIRAEAVVEDLLRDLAQAHADRIQADRERNEARADAEITAEMRADLDRIRADAADTERGATVRAAIAHGALRHMYTEARRQGLKPGSPWDLLALVLDLDTEDQADSDHTPRAALS
ncbi:hypothetical protein ACWY4P_53830 (plasmid) [Streptomyces sp. LZ34]